MAADYLPVAGPPYEVLRSKCEELPVSPRRLENGPRWAQKVRRGVWPTPKKISGGGATPCEHGHGDFALAIPKPPAAIDFASRLPPDWNHGVLVVAVVVVVVDPPG